MLRTSAPPEAELKLLSESIEQPVCCVDRNGLLAFCNRAFAQAFGDGNVEIAGWNFFDLMDAEPLAPAFGSRSALSGLSTDKAKRIPPQKFRRPDGTFHRVGYWTIPSAWRMASTGVCWSSTLFRARTTIPRRAADFAESSCVKSAITRTSCSTCWTAQG